MTDIDAPMRYAEPVTDRSGRDGNVGLVVLLALGLAVAAVGLAVVSREMAEPFVLAILAGLAVVGVFCLFAGAVGILHFGQTQARNDVTKAFVDNLPQGALIADAGGRVLYANEAYRSLLGLDADMVLLAPDPAFAGNAYLAEQIFRLSRAAQQGRARKEEYPSAPARRGRRRRGCSPPLVPHFRAADAGKSEVGPQRGARGLASRRDHVRPADAGSEFREAAAGYRLSRQRPGGLLHRRRRRHHRLSECHARPVAWLGPCRGRGTAAQAGRDHVAGRRGALGAAGRGASHGATRRFDIDLVKADGTTLPVRILHRLPPYGGNGGLAHALVLNRAPGEVEEAGAAELRFARLFNSAPIAIATVDREGAVSTTNAAFVQLFGRAVDGVPGRKVSLASLADAESRRHCARRSRRRSGSRG